MKKIVNLIPMAGLGKRFIEAGYDAPKPLILVDGIPMIVRALESLPKANTNILVIRKHHICSKLLRQSLQQYFSNIEIIEIDHLTKGQADTCLLAQKYVPKDSILNIGSCDVGYKYDIKKYENELNKSDNLVWVYNNNPNVLKNPEMYGWVKLSKENIIEYVSCKKPISKNLMLDPVVSGTFTFKRAEIFFEGVEKMIEKKDLVNMEYYVDSVFNHISKVNKAFWVERYYSWGTPQELKLYEQNKIK